MVALIRDIITDEPTGIHRTALSADGSKIGRKALGLKGGGAIKLSPLMGAGSELLIGEGIETTLSASILGFGSPAWSVIDAGEMSRFPALPGYLAAHHSRRSRRERSRREGRSGDQSAMGGRGLAGPHRDAVDAGRRLQRCPGSAGGPPVTDRANRFQVHRRLRDRTRACVGTGRRAGPSADDGRKALRGILDEIMTQALVWHEALERSRARGSQRRRPTAPSRSRPASASRNLAGRQSPGSSSRPGAEDCPTVFCTPCRRTGWRTRRASKMPDGVTAAVWQGREGTKLGTRRADVPQYRGGKGCAQDRRGGGEHCLQAQGGALPVLRDLPLSGAEGASQKGRCRVRGARNPVPDGQGARQEFRPRRRRRGVLAGRHHRHPPRHRQAGS